MTTEHAIVPATATSVAPVHRPDVMPRVRIRVRQPAAASDTTEEADVLPASAVTTGGDASTVMPTTVPDAGYTVGYGKPPRHTRFAKGQSGNPKGRPKGAKAFKTIVRETLTAKLKIRTAKGPRNVTNVQALMMQTVESALKGSRQDRHELLRYYRDAVPDELQANCNNSGTSSGSGGAPANMPADSDAHDRAILERLRATIIAELGDER